MACALGKRRGRMIGNGEGGVKESETRRDGQSWCVCVSVSLSLLIVALLFPDTARSCAMRRSATVRMPFPFTPWCSRVRASACATSWPGLRRYGWTREASTHTICMHAHQPRPLIAEKLLSHLEALSLSYPAPLYLFLYSHVWGKFRCCDF